MTKIKVSNPIVDIDGDEMTRIIWQNIKDELIYPFLDIDLKYFDLSVTNRDQTGDKVTSEAAQAVKQYGVGVKCATITADPARVKEFSLDNMFPSPNGTIRNYLNGTIFRAPILCKNVPLLVNSWKKPIFVARHAFGDQYRATEMVIKEAGTLKLIFTPDDASKSAEEKQVFRFSQAGIALAMYNLDASINGFAEACFNYGLTQNISVYLSTKNTILRTYDGRFKDIFQRVFDEKYKSAFAAAGIEYEHRLIDDMVAYALKSEGGYLWACKNYDGDVQSDSIAQGFGSLGMMTSVLTSPDGKTVCTEAAHGTVTRHFRQYQQGKKTSTNPIASLFAWTRAIAARGRFDETPQVVEFAEKLEQACVEAVETGFMTKDLALLIGAHQSFLTTDEFLLKVRELLEKRV
ncbi:MAG: NADP-dependent isocitrate dehydrogenase [Alphaproteobacteria bacterium]|nr:NADP-dependent isocitrate dehydrogenase [Alphaproteobacteria bacterium]